MDIKKLNIITGVITLSLFVMLLFTPQIASFIYGVEENESALFMARRSASLFLGIAVISWLSRKSAHSAARQAICLGFALAFSVQAVLGISEFIRGFAGSGIWLAIITELLLGLSYLKIWFANRHID